MKRRDFLKYSAMTAGAISLAPSCMSSNSKKQSDDIGPDLESTTLENPVPMKKSIMWGTVSLKNLSFADACRIVKAAGYDGIEPGSHMDRAEVIDGMAAVGLTASSVCNSQHWNLLLSSPDASVRSEGIKAQIRAMEDAKAYGTDSVLLVPGRVDADTSYRDCWKRSTECIKELVPAAEEMKVNICIENVWNNFLLSSVEARMYVEQFSSERVGWYFDCGNILNLGWPEQWIEILGAHIKRVHIKEFDKTLADKEGRWKGFSVKLADGEVNWKAVMAGLRKYYAGGWLTTEQGPASTPEEIADLASRLDGIMKL
ncbi:MAG: TIM barrel protein [Alistipes sp.]|nr:TIM barrel protein [Candidatus Minthomonas equi]